MKRRETYYSDYGLSAEKVKELKNSCKKLSEDESIMLLMCAMVSNKEITPAIYYSLVYGVSYEAIVSIMDIPISKTDFYAYQRYCLSIFNDSKINPQARIVYGPCLTK